MTILYKNIWNSNLKEEPSSKHMSPHRFVILIAALAILAGCSRPKGGICSTCPVWFLDPICLSGGDAPDPAAARPVTPPPVESDLIPGQNDATYKR